MLLRFIRRTMVAIGERLLGHGAIDSCAVGRRSFCLTLRIGAANAAPIGKVVEFTHDGRWTLDDMAMRRDYLERR